MCECSQWNVLLFLGVLYGFQFYIKQATGNQFQVGLYRPLDNSCSFQVIKQWTTTSTDVGLNIVRVPVFVYNYCASFIIFESQPLFVSLQMKCF